MKHILLSLLLLNGIFSSYCNAYQTEGVALDAEPIVQWAQSHLPQKGVLKENDQGFVYLKVDDGYINQLFPKLSAHNYIKPAYFRRPDSPGAHISVFYVDERGRTGDIKEIGQGFSFKISDLAYVPEKSREYIVIKVKSPELEQLRSKYNLSPLLHGHDFHITIAKKKNKKHYRE
jgi:hypothetical protein